MFQKLRNLLTSADDRKLHDAEAEFDHLMKEVDSDVKDLIQLEEQIHQEFGKLSGKVERIEVGVDELMN